MADSTQISWPSLDAPYVDEFGCIDQDIYQAAGELWRNWAAAFAIATLGDEASGELALKKVCAKITEKRAAGAIKIERLKAYIQTAFKYEVLAQLKRVRSASVDTVEELVAEVDVDIDQKILVEQIMTRMDRENRRIAQLLILGYSFEEIAKQDGTASNILRSKYSKQLTKIRMQLRDIPARRRE